MMKSTNTSLSAAEFDVSPDRGYLPTVDPLSRLPAVFDAWEEIAQNLPKYLVSDHLRKQIEGLPPFPLHELRDERKLRRAMLLLSYLGHAYVWGAGEPATHLPAVLAVPWAEVAARLGRPPVLSYASYALDNWRRLDPNGPVRLGNIALIQNFLGGIDEEWFILIHVDIEAKAAPALQAILAAQQAVCVQDSAGLLHALQAIEAALTGMAATLARMPEYCDPYIYFHRVRPYIHGWKNNPALPDGLVYQGVDAFGGQGQLFRGETGAQSSIIPALDAALGVAHKDDPLKAYLLEMRDYMPTRHREFLTYIAEGPSVREAVLAQQEAAPALAQAYNACVALVERFRSMHLEYAARYIFKQAQTDNANPSQVGTGGTPFMAYLKKHRDETTEHALPEK